MSWRRLQLSLVLACVVLVSIGCSGRPKNLAPKVTGKVTLGGQPLAKATVVFTPTSTGSPSFGQTDDSGNYYLVWGQQRGRRIEGAQIGEHTVTITTFKHGDPSLKPPRPDVPEKVPHKYRESEGLPKVTVNKGVNTIDITLEAGPVEAPQPKGKGKTKGKAK